MLQRYRAQTLGDRIVDFAGDAVALAEDG